MAFQERLVATHLVPGADGVALDLGLVEEEKGQLLRQPRQDVVAVVAPLLGDRFRFAGGPGGNLAHDEGLDLAQGADVAQFLVLDGDADRFLDGQDDFQQGQRIDPQDPR